MNIANHFLFFSVLLTLIILNPRKNRDAFGEIQ